MMLSAAERTSLLDASRPLAKLAFGLLLVLSPFRARIEIAARPDPPLYGDYTDFLLFWSDLAVLLTLGLWAVSLAARRRPVSFGPAFLALPVAGLLLVGWCGVPFAIDPALAAYTALRLTVMAALALYVVNEFEGLTQLRAPLAAMLAIQAVVVVAQVAGQHSVGLQGVGEHDLAPSLPVSVITALDGSRLVRGYGLADHPNILGGLLAFAMLLVVVPRRDDDGGARVLARHLFAIGAVALLLTFSRSAALGLIVGFAVLLGMLAGGATRDRAGVRGLVGAGLVATLACLPFLLAYGPYALARTDVSGAIETEARSANEREALTLAANEVFLAHPVLGVGLGGLPIAMRDAEPDFPFTYQPAHVVLVDVAAETGAVGALLYLAILVAPWLALVRHRHRWTPELAAASAALAAVTVVGLFDYYTWSYPAGRIWSWVILALWAAAYRRAAARATAPERPEASRAPAGAPLAEAAGA